MAIEEILRVLGTKTGLGELRLDDDGWCQLVFDDELVVDLGTAGAGGDFHLSATVGPAPEGDAAALTELLEANLLGQATGGAWLALDGALEEVVLCRRFDVDVDHATFERGLESFLNHLEAWRRRLAERPAEAMMAGAPPRDDLLMIRG